MLAGVGSGVFGSVEEGVGAMVRLDERVFETDASKRAAYDERFELYKDLWPRLRGYTGAMARQTWVSAAP
jgi:sugar (pentulose or hexulose) kinase